MAGVLAFLMLAVAGQVSGTGEKTTLTQQLDLVVGKPIILTGIARGFGGKGGSLEVFGSDPKESINFNCDAWPREMETAYAAADRDGADIWVSMRVTIGMNPPGVRSGAPFVQTNEFVVPRYRLDYEEIVEYESVKRQTNGAPSLVGRIAIRADHEPRKATETNIPKLDLPAPNGRTQQPRLPMPSALPPPANVSLP